MEEQDQALPEQTELQAEPAADESSNQPADAAAAFEGIDPARVVEAILLASDSPMTAQKIAGVMEVGTGRDVKKHIEALNAQYEELGLSFRIEEIAGGFQILTLPTYNHWLKKLLRVRQETKLTGAAMETLAIVAYKQPCTRADVETIRGVSIGDVMNRLRDMNMVKIVGRAEDLGRPILYGTTRRFLEVFGLASLDDLPQVEVLKSGASAGKKVGKPEGPSSETNESGETEEAASDSDESEHAMESSDATESHRDDDDALDDNVDSLIEEAHREREEENEDGESPTLSLVRSETEGDESDEKPVKRKAARQ